MRVDLHAETKVFEVAIATIDLFPPTQSVPSAGIPFGSYSSFYLPIQLLHVLA